MGKEVKPDRSTTVREKLWSKQKEAVIKKVTKGSFRSVNI